MKTISKKQFSELTKGLKVYDTYTSNFRSVEDLMDMEEDSLEELLGDRLILICDIPSLIKEGEFSIGCTKSTPLEAFKVGKKYRIAVGDPLILTVEVVGLLDYYSDGEITYLILKTDGGNLVCVRILGSKWVFSVEILEELEF